MHEGFVRVYQTTHDSLEQEYGHPFEDLKQHVNKSSLSTRRGGFLYYVSERKAVRKVFVTLCPIFFVLLTVHPDINV